MVVLLRRLLSLPPILLPVLSTPCHVLQKSDSSLSTSTGLVCSLLVVELTVCKCPSYRLCGAAVGFALELTSSLKFCIPHVRAFQAYLLSLTPKSTIHCGSLSLGKISVDHRSSFLLWIMYFAPSVFPSAHSTHDRNRVCWVRRTLLSLTSSSLLKPTVTNVCISHLFLSLGKMTSISFHDTTT